MPKIYEYFGLIFFINTDDHKPVHVHIKYAGYESKVEIEYEKGGKLKNIVLKKVTHKQHIPVNKQSDAINFVKKFHSKITDKWTMVIIKKETPAFEKILKKV